MNSSNETLERAGDGSADAGDPRDRARRARIIEATYCLLMERGYAGAGTSEIARRAKISKRELYALFGSKDGVLTAMIGSRAARMREPLAVPEALDLEGLADVLTRFGASLLKEGSSGAVVALTRLAIAEAERAPDLARRLDADGRRPTRTALADLLARALSRGLIAGADSQTMAGQFLSLLWGGLQMRLLLRLAEPPGAEEIERRAKAAVAALLALYPTPISSAKEPRPAPRRRGGTRRG